MFKARKKHLPPPPREHVYLERVREDVYRVIEPERGETENFTAAGVLEAFEIGDIDALSKVLTEAANAAPVLEIDEPAQDAGSEEGLGDA